MTSTTRSSSATSRSTRQIALDNEVVDLFGHRAGTWRIDPTEHPFASGAGIDDIRITTHYYEDSLKSLFATMHEYGHGLYEHQIPRRFAHLPIGTGASLGLHESQSRLWENLVGRSRPFWRFFYPRLQEIFPEQLRAVELERFYAGINHVQPSLIRIHADEVTYGMHVILRFELEQDIVNGRVELRDLPQRWAEKMDEYLGVEVPDDAHGVLQDMHWACGPDRLLLHVSARHRHVGADLGARRSRTSPTSRSRSSAATSRRCASGSARTCTRTVASSRRRRRSRHATGSTDRREAVPRVPEEEVRRTRHRLSAGLPFFDPAP